MIVGKKVFQLSTNNSGNFVPQRVLEKSTNILLRCISNKTLTFKSTYVRCFALSKARILTSRHLQTKKVGALYD